MLVLTEQFRREYIRYLSFCLSCGTEKKNVVRRNDDLESPDGILSPETNRTKPPNRKDVVEMIPDQNEYNTKLWDIQSTHMGTTQGQID